MPAHYKLQIITPQGVTYEGDVVHSLVPSDDGYVGVLANHAPYITSSPGGKFQVRETNNPEEKSFRVGLGFFEVNKNQATFLTRSFEDGPK